MAVAVALDERDQPTYHHCSRVVGLSMALGRQSALSARELRLLCIAAAFHDVGKIGIPDGILNKPSPFNKDDWAIMKTHAMKSQRIVLAAGFKDGDIIGLAVRHHHERYDGAGYPDGLAGESIPILARIVAIADAYDAMAAKRSYRPAMPHVEIMEELKREQGFQHDPWLVGKFAGVIEQTEFRTPQSEGERKTHSLAI